MNRQKQSIRGRFRRLLAAVLLAASLGAADAAYAHGPVHGFLSYRPSRQPVAGAHSSIPPQRFAVTNRTRRPVLSKEEIAERLKYSTCWIVGESSSGTGWVFNVSQRLVVTNYHVVDGVQTIRVYFPVKTDGEWNNDIRHYVRNVKPIDATVIHADRESDLAVIQLQTIPGQIVALPLAEKSPPQGAQLHTLGAYTNGSSALWTYTFGVVRLVGRGPTALGGTTRIVEAQLEYNKGNSGGPIVNDRGELVAVVEGYRNRGTTGDSVRNVSVAIDVRQVRVYLKTTGPLVAPKTAAQFVQRGIGYTNLGRFELAISDFSSAIKLDASFAPAYARKALALHLMGKNTAALKEIEKALRLDASLGLAYQVRGRCHQAAQNHDQAIADFTTAIRHEPKNAAHYNFRGLSLLAIGRTSVAWDDFSQASKLDPENSEYLGNRAHVARLLKRHKDAVENYVKAYKLNPRRHDYLNGLGLIFLEIKDYDQAAQAFTLANTVYKALNHKDYWVYQVNLGLALSSAGEYSQAIAAFTKAIRLNPRNATLYYLRGKSLADSGRRDLAAADYKKAAQLDPQHYGQLVAAAPQQP